MAIRERGFTMIELVIVVAVIAILASIAYTQYTSSYQRANRTDAKNALVDLAARQERYRFGRNEYTASLTDLGLTSSVVNGNYEIAIIAADDATFSARAVPQGAQANDHCGTLTLDNAGRKGVEPSNPDMAEECWR